jgi:hypothetical protein
MRKIHWFLALGCLAGGLAIVPVFAQGAKQRTPAGKPAEINQPPAAQPVAAQPAAAPAPDTSADARIVVEGFRSSRFGMNEADVRAAIAKDFGVKPEAIKTQDNPAELTHSLVVTVADLLTNGGASEVSYVLGYKSKSLIQVGVSWSKTTDAALTPERLFSNANILRAHFLNEGFKPDTIAVNTPVNGGLLMFRASDAKDHTVMLLLQGTFETKDNNQRTLTPTGLLLFYVADAKSPDVFKLPPGQF